VRRIFATFFYSLRSKSKRIWILFSLHIGMFQHICKHHLFASFTSYLLQNIRTNSRTNIRFYVKQIHVEANIRFRANIRFIFSHTGEYSLQNIRFEANICLQIFAYKRIFACILANIRNVLLQNLWEGFSQVLNYPPVVS
jgi:hypothetical protein